MEKTFLVLDQYREESEYNDFIGKFYHFPKKYISYFPTEDEIEFVYYEPKKKGKGVYYGYGKLIMKPFEDKREKDCYFIEIKNYKKFKDEVPFENENGPREKPPFYNPQNAIRKIEHDILEEICLDGGILLNFTADAHLIKVLGEQLIASEKIGILELIKNSIDANSSYCNIRIEKLPILKEIDESKYRFNEFPGPVIVIDDDGIGMTKDIIERGWLRPASTIKTSVKERIKQEREKAILDGKLGAYESIIKQLKKEYKNRIPLGEKGVGRFATHRLGRYLILISKVKDLDYEFVLTIDWNAFDSASISGLDLDSIGVSLSRQKPSRDYGKNNSGTRLIIYGGREGFVWDANKVLEINQSILRINSPNPQPGKKNISFKASVECPQIENIPSNQIFSEFPPNFSFDVLINESGIADFYSISFKPPRGIPMTEDKIEGEKYDLKASYKDYWKDQQGNTRKPECGMFFMHIDVWYRRKEWLIGPDYSQMLKYLDEYGGISLYRDDVLIEPAESGSKNDWLGFSLKKTKQAFHISYYEMIGNIEINQSDNIYLIDKTNREGMIRNNSYLDMAKLASSAVYSLLQPIYQNKRDEHTNLTKGLIRDPKQLVDISKQSLTLVQEIQNNYPIEADPQGILKFLGTNEVKRPKLVNLEQSLKNLKKSLELIDEVQEKLTEEAGFGLAIAVSVHEIAKLTSNFYVGLTELLKSNKYSKSKIEDLLDSSKSLRTELKRLGPLRAIKSEIRASFNIQRSIKFVSEIKRKKLEKFNIKLGFNSDSDFIVYGRYGAMNQILSNLIDNSMYWIDTEENNTDRRIFININSDERYLIFSDNGPGISNVIRKYLFEPGYSLKQPPSGLGLYISKHYMYDLGGNISEAPSKYQLPNILGAQFFLDFENVPERKEDF